MPKLAKPLSDAQVKRAKAGDTVVKLFDGHGLYLEVQPSGAKFWRFRYRQANGKETTIAFGPYPEVSLADARSKPTERVASCWNVEIRCSSVSWQGAKASGRLNTRSAKSRPSGTT